MTNVQENRIKITTFVVLILTNILILIDVINDVKDGIPPSHLVHEMALWLFSILGAFYQYKIIRWQKREMLGIQDKLQQLGIENSKLLEEKKDFQSRIASFSNAFRDSIDEQFNKWSFSKGEKEIALLLIKGLSMKEIADIRGTNESTVRQQASLIYKKSSLSGRLELSAFFLDDLLSLSN